MQTMNESNLRQRIYIIAGFPGGRCSRGPTSDLTVHVELENEIEVIQVSVARCPRVHPSSGYTMNSWPAGITEPSSSLKIMALIAKFTEFFKFAVMNLFS